MACRSTGSHFQHITSLVCSPPHVLSSPDEAAIHGPLHPAVKEEPITPLSNRLVDDTAASSPGPLDSATASSPRLEEC